MNKALGIKLIAKTGEKALVKVAKIVPFVGSAIAGWREWGDDEWLRTFSKSLH